MSDDILVVEDLAAAYAGREVISNLNFTLKHGEVLCLLGHNGAGKSTLLKVLFGMHPIYRGCVFLRGKPIQPHPAEMARSGVAYMPEGRGVFPSLTVREIFDLALYSGGITGRERKQRIKEVLDVLPRIGDFYQRRAGTLSGGQQQMVSIGRVLLSRPEVLFLDEPSIGLAPKLFQDLLIPVRAVQKARKMSIILVEQNVHDAFAISDRVLVMKSGSVLFRGVPADLSDHTRLMELF